MRLEGFFLLQHQSDQPMDFILCHPSARSCCPQSLRWPRLAVSSTNVNSGKCGELRNPPAAAGGQKEIVAEIEGYQKVIDGARAVLDHYRPHIPIHPDGRWWSW